MAEIKRKSYGKQFERQVYKNLSEFPGVSIDRVPDQVTKYKGSSSNICDFIVYKYPTLIYLECKSTHGASLPIYSEPKPDKKGELHGFYGNIRDNQWEGLLEKSKIRGVKAGVLIWFVDKDVTVYYSIEALQYLRSCNRKSVRFDEDIDLLEYDMFVYEGIANRRAIPIVGKKKRTMFEYDFNDFLTKI